MTKRYNIAELIRDETVLVLHQNLENVENKRAKKLKRIFFNSLLLKSEKNF